MAESREALDVFRRGSELRFRRRCRFHAIDRAAVRRRDQRRAVVVRDRDDLFFRHVGNERHVAVFVRVESSLRSGRQKNRSVRAAADGVDHLTIELAGDLDEAVGIDLVQLTGAGLRVRGAAVFKGKARFDGDGRFSFLLLFRRSGRAARRRRLIRRR